MQKQRHDKHMDKLLQAYLDSKKDQWSETTTKSVASKLKSIDTAYLPLDPASLHADLVRQGYGAYSVKQMMLLAAQVCKYGVASGVLPSEAYTGFLKTRSRLFANAYTPKKVPASFEEAVTAIKSMGCAASRDFAIGLLVSGLRISEASKLVDSTVIGKGNKLRSVPNAELVRHAPPKSIATFRRELAKATGLTPHQLRKLAATKFVKLGAREAELCSIFGWSSYQTASIYIQAENVSDMATQMKEAVNGK